MKEIEEIIKLIENDSKLKDFNNKIELSKVYIHTLFKIYECNDTDLINELNNIK